MSSGNGRFSCKPIEGLFQFKLINYEASLAAKTATHTLQRKGQTPFSNKLFEFGGCRNHSQTAPALAEQIPNWLKVI
jgi:hypothetical protein